MEQLDWTHVPLEFYEDALLDAVVRSGLFTRLVRGTTRRALNRAFSCPERLLDAALAALRERDWISEDDDTGELHWTGKTEVSEALYRMYELRRWCLLAEYLRPEPYTVPRAWLLAADQSRLVATIRGMADELIAHLNPAPGSQWLDVGGGNGCLANALTQSGAHVTVVDRREVFQGFPAAFAPSVTRVTGDILTSVPDGVYDGVVLLRFVECIPRHRLRDLLKTMTPHLRPHTGRIYIIGYLRHLSSAAGLFSLQTAIMDRGSGSYSLEEISCVAEHAGLHLARLENEGLQDYTLAELAPKETLGTKR